MKLIVERATSSDLEFCLRKDGAKVEIYTKQNGVELDEGHIGWFEVVDGRVKFIRWDHIDRSLFHRNIDTKILVD